MSMDLREQSGRRTVVVATYAGYALLMASMVLGRTVHPAFALAMVPGAVVFVLALWRLVRATRPYSDEMAGTKRPVFDERQDMVRGRANVRAYQIFSGVATLWIFYQALATDLRRKFPVWLPSTWDEHQVVVWTTLLLALTLPAAIVAWTEPDPVERDVQDSRDTGTRCVS